MRDGDVYPEGNPSNSIPSNSKIVKKFTSHFVGMDEDLIGQAILNPQS